MNPTKCFSLSVLIFVVSCAYIPYQFKSQYTEEVLPEVTPISGDNAITGVAFRKRDDGIIVTCAGDYVRLQKTVMNIRSPYAIEANSLTGNKAIFSRIDPRHLEFERQLKILRDSQRLTTKCDIEGKFTFMDIPPGDYQIGTIVSWDDENGYNGGYLSEFIEIPEGSSGKEFDVVLSD